MKSPIDKLRDFDSNHPTAVKFKHGIIGYDVLDVENGIDHRDTIDGAFSRFIINGLGFVPEVNYQIYLVDFELHSYVGQRLEALISTQGDTYIKDELDGFTGYDEKLFLIVYKGESFCIGTNNILDIMQKDNSITLVAIDSKINTILQLIHKLSYGEIGYEKPVKKPIIYGTEPIQLDINL